MRVIGLRFQRSDTGHAAENEHTGRCIVHRPQAGQQRVFLVGAFHLIPGLKTTETAPEIPANAVRSIKVAQVTMEDSVPLRAKVSLPDADRFHVASRASSNGELCVE